MHSNTVNSRKRVLIFVIVTAALAAVCITALLLFSGSRKRAYVYSEGKLIRTIELIDGTTEEFTVTTESGYNVIRAENGRIGVIDADCPDKTCVHTGYTDNSFLPVICIPHKLEIVVGDE